MVILLDLEKRPPLLTDEEITPLIKHELKHGTSRRRRFPLSHFAIIGLIVLLYKTFDFTQSHRDNMDHLRPWDAKDHDHHDHQPGKRPQQNCFEKLFL